MKINKHFTYDEVWEYIDTQSLPPERKNHLADCIECQALIADVKTIDLELKDLAYSQPSMSFSRRVVDRWESSKLNYPVFIAAAIGVFIILLGLSVMLSLQMEATRFTSLIQWSILITIVSFYWLWDSYRTKNMNLR